MAIIFSLLLVTTVVTYLKTPITILFLLISQLCWSQVNTNEAVISNYKKIFSGLDSITRQSASMILQESPANGFAVFTQFKVDTLEFKAEKNTIRITEIDNKENSANNSTVPDTLAIAMVFFKKVGNDLNITLGTPFGDFCRFQIINDKTIAFYLEDVENSFFWLKPGQRRSNKLEIPVKIINIILSNKTPGKGEEIYGEAEVQTDPYFEASAFDNDHSFLKKQILLKFVFKARNIQK